MNGYIDWIRSALSDDPTKSQAGIARALGRDKSAITRLLNEGRELKAREIRIIADYLGVEPPITEDVPLVTFAAAGGLVEAETVERPGEIEDYLPNPGLGPGRWIALKVEGDSMNRIAPDGSVIFVDRNDKNLFDGACYVFRLHDETTFKMFRLGPRAMRRIAPYSTNPAHQDIFPDHDFLIVGRVRKVVTNL